MQVLQRILSDPETCAYLPDRDARLEFRLAVDVSPATMDRLLARGWRRFGFAYFRPACDHCSACVSIRLPVREFRPSRSQRRARGATADLLWTYGPPKVDPDRLALLHRWHRDREATHGWREQVMDAERYELEFAVPHPCARELTAWTAPDGEGVRRPVVVTLVDDTPEALSAAYTFFDPSLARKSPGTAAIVRLVDVARDRGKRWVYLGYRVLGCVSSEYKARFRPHELARGWPDLDEPEPEWAKAGRVSGSDRSGP